jgi:hypothetical protein
VVQVVPRPQIASPCRLTIYRSFLRSVDEFVDEFEISENRCLEIEEMCLEFNNLR